MAAHAAGLGAQVSFYGVRGEDEVGRFAESEMINLGIHCGFDLIQVGLPLKNAGTASKTNRY